MELRPKTYPIGIQDFAKLRNGGYVYVDKTEWVYQLARHDQCIFLSRPRRFGKSLLLSTLDYYFQGRKDLFEGLEISKYEHKWECYPIFHFDLSELEATSEKALKLDLSDMLEVYEKAYKISYEKTPSIGKRFGNLIKKAYIETGKGVVVLIDEYDKGILEAIHDEKKLEKNRAVLRNFFMQLKSNDKCLRFAMLTGVSRFHHLTIFSGLNNLVDISMDPEYATICGITLEEMNQYFKQGLEENAKAHEINTEALIDTLKQKYDGYRFSSRDAYVFNPYSLLNALNVKEYNNFWIVSGTSKVFVDFLVKSDFRLDALTQEWYDKECLMSTYDSKNPVPLLYQTGYLTIEKYQDELYKLTVPNGEVRKALIEQLMPAYMGISENIPFKLMDLKKMILSGDIDGWLSQLKSMMASAPYQLLSKGKKNPVERFYHLMIYQIFILLGIDTRSEITIAGGRIDMVAQTSNLIYVMEFKLNGTAQEALNQIDDKGYAIPYNADGRQLYKIGVSFSGRTHIIKDWIVEKM